MPTSHAAGWMKANFSCASVNFCVTFVDAFLSEPLSLSATSPDEIQKAILTPRRKARQVFSFAGLAHLR
jgi:hypothetical protein